MRAKKAISDLRQEAVKPVVGHFTLNEKCLQERELYWKMCPLSIPIFLSFLKFLDMNGVTVSNAACKVMFACEILL